MIFEMIYRGFSLKSCKIIISGHLSRCLSTCRLLQKCSKVKDPQIKSDNCEKWTTIYKLEQVRLFSTANKIKIHQGILTTLLCPLSWAGEVCNYIPEGSFVAVTAIGVSGFLALNIFTLLLRNVVGFIYLNNTEERIKIAYVGFLGQRKEAEHLVKDVISADDLPPSKYKFYYPLSFRNSRAKYTIFYKRKSMEDIEKFAQIFGYDLI